MTAPTTVLNLYAGIGGNRALWSNVTVTAVEHDPAIAAVYASRFPDDLVIVADAHTYLLENFARFDFVWSSPPCPSHGQYRYNVGVRAKGYKPLFPDMALYEEIILLRHHHEGRWAVENTVPYYEPLVAPTARLQRHLVWANFPIAPKRFAAKGIRSKSKVSDYDDLGVDLSASGIANKRQVLRNAVDPELGLHIFEAAMLRDEVLL